MSTKTLTVTLFLFTALTLTHAALVNYRSGAAEVQPQFRADPAKLLLANEMAYLQTRKFAAPELALENYRSGDRQSVWRGITRTIWTESGLCCGVFELLAKMKGAKTRTRILNALREPKNKLQLAHELGVDWKAVDGHVRKLLSYGLVSEVAVVGTCRLYAITQKGTRAL
ncbi:MAG: hypothetical protein MN733_24650, partial [Nitrososphaera sp.]|nr:hypothetical protein [Nitrososphaera sp.]